MSIFFNKDKIIFNNDMYINDNICIKKINNNLNIIIKSYDKIKGYYINNLLCNGIVNICYNNDLLLVNNKKLEPIIIK